ncbi:hypothetical protein BBBOND_0108990 [Babesia bigemina]|uniref:Uncharacterized protein n=1 Tax=Babesia bigemina TaxID=5866 RepID=A0A061D1B8_BABBI|nr:hypothetical protein BBBOND_0108990 [Babesia bigemina]CDR94601.1 hypothetical protein BBBOND_0108990 [Babesia bigemina]|eukprot:XP_012766787.1 hypothetical protein BBBOND_0108990 [Babesia bigemina]
MAYNIERTGVGSDYTCDPSICEDQCKQCTNPKCQCKCPCCRGKNPETLSADCSLHSSKARPLPSVAARSSNPDSKGDDLSTAYPSVIIPVIIAPVALIVLVICVMSYFRVRPFHRVRYLLRG